MKKNFSNTVLLENTEFSVSVLPSNVHPFIIANFGFFSANEVDKWKNVPHETRDNLPYLPNAAAQYRCKVKNTIELSSHYLYLCEVLEEIQTEKNPLIYDDYKREIRKQTSKYFAEYKSSGISPLI